MKFGLCIGHSRYIDGKRDGGALAADKKTNEWTYNSRIARLVAAAMTTKGHSIIIYDRYEGSGYTRAMTNLGLKMKADKIQCAVEMHFNWNDGYNDDIGHGHEWLYWHTSKNGKLLAQYFDASEKRIIPAIRPRGIQPRKDGRGAAFLENTYCPALVAEPFFGDDDWDKITDEKVAAVYVDALCAYAAASPIQ